MHQFPPKLKLFSQGSTHGCKRGVWLPFINSLYRVDAVAYIICILFLLNWLPCSVALPCINVLLWWSRTVICELQSLLIDVCSPPQRLRMSWIIPGSYPLLVWWPTYWVGLLSLLSHFKYTYICVPAWVSHLCLVQCFFFSWPVARKFHIVPRHYPLPCPHLIAWRQPVESLTWFYTSLSPYTYLLASLPLLYTYRH